MKRVILDQNLPSRTAGLLRARGWDAVHVDEIGLTHADDQSIIEWTLKEKRVCITRDADFHALLAVSSAEGPSVVRIRLDELTYQQTAEMLVMIWARFEQELDSGALVTLTREKVRCRKLPIR